MDTIPTLRIWPRDVPAWCPIWCLTLLLPPAQAHYNTGSVSFGLGPAVLRARLWIDALCQPADQLSAPDGSIPDLAAFGRGANPL
jgi:hypothetical protein